MGGFFVWMGWFFCMGGLVGDRVDNLETQQEEESACQCTGGRQLLDDIKPFPLLPHTREDMCFLLHHRAKPDPFKNLKVEENYQAHV